MRPLFTNLLKRVHLAERAARSGKVNSRFEPAPQSGPKSKRRIRPLMRMTQAVYVALMQHLGYRGREEGGLLIGPANSDIVTTFLLDEAAYRTSTTYTLDATSLNARLAEYLRLGYDAKGIAHCHPGGINFPSVPDCAYVRTALANPKNTTCHEYYLPIICDGQLWPFVVRRESPDHVIRAELVLV